MLAGLLVFLEDIIAFDSCMKLWDLEYRMVSFETLLLMKKTYEMLGLKFYFRTALCKLHKFLGNGIAVEILLDLHS